MKKMQVILCSGIVLLFLISFIHADEVTQDLSQQTITEAGILPDSPLYNAKIGIQKVTELFSENAKIAHAEQRLKEIETMIFFNKTKNINKPAESFDKLYDKIQNKTRLEEHRKIIDNLGMQVRLLAMHNGLNASDKDVISQIKTTLNIGAKNIAEERNDNILTSNKKFNN